MCTLFTLRQAPDRDSSKKALSQQCLVFSWENRWLSKIWFYCKRDNVPLECFLFRKTKMVDVNGRYFHYFPLYALKYVNYNIVCINTKTKSYINLIYLFNQNSLRVATFIHLQRSAINCAKKWAKFRTDFPSRVWKCLNTRYNVKRDIYYINTDEKIAYSTA